jgi:hypothetical protein
MEVMDSIVGDSSCVGDGSRTVGEDISVEVCTTD